MPTTIRRKQGVLGRGKLQGKSRLRLGGRGKQRREGERGKKTKEGRFFRTLENKDVKGVIGLGRRVM